MFEISQIDEYRNFAVSLNSIERLSQDEELQLIKEYKETGSLIARNKVVQNCSLYILGKCSKYLNTKFDIMDLFQEGVIGLIRALNKFEIGGPATFLTYANNWIHCYINDFTIKHETIVTTTIQVGRRLRKEARAKGVFRDNKSLNETNERGEELLNVIVDNRLNQEEILQLKEYSIINKNKIDIAMSTLTDKEKEVIKLRYYGNSIVSFDKLEPIFNMTRQGIRYVEIRAFKKMKQNLYNHKRQYLRDDQLG